MKRFAIVGCGRAGYECAATLRKRLKDCHIDIFDDRGGSPANPMLTTYYAGGQIERGLMFPYGEEVKRLGAELYTGTPVEEISADRELRLADGRVFGGYEGILVSTGAEASIPGFLQINRDELFLMRTPSDAEALRKRLRTRDVKAAAVIGASMVGIKVAEVLYNAGARVTLIDAAERVFPLAAYPQTAKRIAKALEAKGIKLILGAKVSGIDEKGCFFGDGKREDADLLSLCIGTRPRASMLPKELIRAGIVVNERMETGFKGVYAAGDCCEGRELQSGRTMPIGLWQNAALGGRCAGTNMAGGRAVFEGDILHNSTHFFGLDFTGLGDNRLEGERHTLEKEGVYIEAVTSGKRLLGMNILGEPRVGGIYKSLLLKQCRGESGGLTPAQRGILLSMGATEDFLEAIGG